MALDDIQLQQESVDHTRLVSHDVISPTVDVTQFENNWENLDDEFVAKEIVWEQTSPPQHQPMEELSPSRMEKRETYRLIGII